MQPVMQSEWREKLLKRTLLSLLLVGTELFCLSSQAKEGQVFLSTEPELYGGSRGNEPLFQNIVSAKIDGESEKGSTHPWAFSLHYEAETLGRRDQSFDLDRAWIAVTPHLTVGRLHPWDLGAGASPALRPWGYAAQLQSQNRGIQFGEVIPGQDVFPNPIIMGWIGANFWSAPRDSQAVFQWGFSASPLFVPSMGAEVTFSNSSDSSRGRFAQTPPGYVDVNGELLPIRYEIDQSRVLQDVVLQPQLMAQGTWQPRLGSARAQGWIYVSRQPVPDPVPDTNGVVRIDDSGLNALAQVTPAFPEKWQAGIGQDLRPDGWFDHSGAFVSLAARQGGVWGYEAGLSSDHSLVSFMNEPGQEASSSGSVQISNARYAAKLLQAEARLPCGWATPYAGTKTHLSTGDTWIRAGIATQIGSEHLIDFGFDIFGGADGTYFGDYRTNDRIRILWKWRIGT